MPQRDLSHLTDILEAARLIESFIHEIDRKILVTLKVPCEGSSSLSI